ncbi:MAG: hypothetical protein KAI34_00410 [Candidatus Lokiarchaeota archaeon]|nr:hypothetical protein [Candidatus Lokiarchaeota archaeon]
MIDQKQIFIVRTFKKSIRRVCIIEERSVNVFYWIWLIVIIGGIIEIVLGVLSLLGIRYWIIPDTLIGALLLFTMGILILMIAVIFASHF